MVGLENRSHLNYPGYTLIFPSRVSLKGVSADNPDRQVPSALASQLSFTFPLHVDRLTAGAVAPLGNHVLGEPCWCSFFSSSLLFPPPGW